MPTTRATLRLAARREVCRQMRMANAAEADETTRQREERFVDVVATVVADEQSLELVEPGEGAFDHPAVAAQAGAVTDLASCDLRRDTASA